MSKNRKKIHTETIKDPSIYGYETKEELLNESNQYDPDQYDPLENLDDKEIVSPKKKTEIVTIRLTKEENQLLQNIADQKGLSKSSFIRMVVRENLLKTKH